MMNNQNIDKIFKYTHQKIASAHDEKNIHEKYVNFARELEGMIPEGQNASVSILQLRNSMIYALNAIIEVKDEYDDDSSDVSDNDDVEVDDPKFDRKKLEQFLDSTGQMSRTNFCGKCKLEESQHENGRCLDGRVFAASYVSKENTTTP